MSDRSAIEWTDFTWPVVTGCTKVSDGCSHCYIERTVPFRMARRWFDKPGIGDLGKKAAGRELDGREWNEYPKVVTNA